MDLDPRKQEHTPLEPDPVMAAFDEYGRHRSGFLHTVSAAAYDFSSEQVDAVAESASDLIEAFRDTVTAVIESGEFDNDQKANQIATLLVDDDEARVSYFRKLAPEGIFRDLSVGQEELAEYIKGEFELYDEPDQAIVGLMTGYADSLSQDAREFIETMLQKPDSLLKRVGRHVLEFGKLSAAAAVGSLIARKIAKSLDDRAG
jgi:hypothetical protein